MTNKYILILATNHEFLGYQFGVMFGFINSSHQERIFFENFPETSKENKNDYIIIDK